MNASYGRLLLVEDEPQIIRALRPSLAAGGFEVTVVQTGAEAIGAVAAGPFDAMVLDLGLPDMDGKEVISTVRARSDIPIVVVSARGLEDEKVAALDLGANDFVSKPAPVRELLARIRAALRGRGRQPPRLKTFQDGELAIDFESRRARIGHRSLRLTQKETEFLLALVGRSGRVASHRQLIADIWGAEADVDTQVVRVLAAQTRHKIEADPSRPVWIVTEPGLGYRLGGPSTAAE